MPGIRLAVVRLSDNVVVNCVVGPEDGGEWAPPAGHIAVPSEYASVGWLYDPGQQMLYNPEE